jgi:hypothetical protein
VSQGFHLGFQCGRELNSLARPSASTKLLRLLGQIRHRFCGKISRSAFDRVNDALEVRLLSCSRSSA